jgi:hypothetical protein
VANDARAEDQIELFAIRHLAQSSAPQPATQRPGRFILTGSTNVLLVPRLADSLAGRIEIRRLYPLSQCELMSTPARFLDALFTGTFRMERYA